MIKPIDKAQILKETEKYMRENVPSLRKSKDGSDAPYLDHVLGVRKYALELAALYNADKFVVEMAALLHDIGGDAGGDHAQESVKIAGPFLKQFNLPSEVVADILGCIANHSVGTVAQTDEQQIIQDADGIIFIEDTYRFYFDYCKSVMNLEEARKASIKKTKRMVKKVKTERGMEFANKFLPKALEYIRRAS